MQAEVLTTAAGVPVQGPLLLTPRVFGDERGFFFESWNQQAFNAAAGDTAFVQDNHSRSSRGVLRGLHYQLPPHPQGKLVRCVLGRSSMWRSISAAVRPRSASGWGQC